MRTFNRYLMFSVPTWALAAVGAVALWHWLGVSAWLACAGWALWVIKDFVLYPLVKGAYERDIKTGADSLVGKRGVVQRRLAPRGFVRVRGALWQAEIEPGKEPIEAGETVRILRARGLTLVVAGADEQTGASES
jgi:membrane protein implicated in regulation of membrane protease activity